MHNDEKKFKKVKAKSKGTLFEEIIKILTIETKIFSLLENITNDTNEYDIIIKPSKLARSIYNAIPKVVYQPIICECKNYASNVNVTWIGKLYSLLSLSNIKLGIIFSYEGLTGEHSKDNKTECWTDAIGLIRKIFLKEGIAIISIDKYDLQEIINGERFYDVVEKKYNELVLTTDISKEKIYHPSNEKAQKIIDDINNQVKELNSLIK